jgi:hypothetical protein
MARSCFLVIVMSSHGCVNHVARTEIYPPAAVHLHTLKGAIAACAGNSGGSSPAPAAPTAEIRTPCGIGAKHPARKRGCRPAVCRAANPGCFVLARRANAAGAALTLSRQRSDAFAAHHTCAPFTVTWLPALRSCRTSSDHAAGLDGDSQLERVSAGPQSTALEVLAPQVFSNTDPPSSGTTSPMFNAVMVRCEAVLHTP